MGFPVRQLVLSVAAQIFIAQALIVTVAVEAEGDHEKVEKRNKEYPPHP